jgi:hypothetical protein
MVNRVNETTATEVHKIRGTSEQQGQEGAQSHPFRFDRVELAGAFGDLGTLLPIVIGMILINHLSPSTVFLSFGLFYLVVGGYYGLPIPIQPLKAVGAIAIAYPAIITETVIGTSGVIFGAIMLLLALTGLVDRIAKLFSDRKSTRLNSSHRLTSRMPSSA